MDTLRSGELVVGGQVSSLLSRGRFEKKTLLPENGFEGKIPMVFTSRDIKVSCVRFSCSLTINGRVTVPRKTFVKHWYQRPLDTSRIRTYKKHDKKNEAQGKWVAKDDQGRSPGPMFESMFLLSPRGVSHQSSHQSAPSVSCRAAFKAQFEPEARFHTEPGENRMWRPSSQ